MLGDQAWFSGALPSAAIGKHREGKKRQRICHMMLSADCACVRLAGVRSELALQGGPRQLMLVSERIRKVYNSYLMQLQVTARSEANM